MQASVIQSAASHLLLQQHHHQQQQQQHQNSQLVQSQHNLLPPTSNSGSTIGSTLGSTLGSSLGVHESTRSRLAAYSDNEDDDEVYTRNAKRENLARRPSYKRILDDLAHTIPTSAKIEEESSNSDRESNVETSNPPFHAPPGIIPTSAMYHLANNSQRLQSLTSYSGQSISSTHGADAPTILQYTSDNTPYFISPAALSQCNDNHPQDVTRKREMRLLKNREAARECRRKKKEYVKCLENRVDVLETQNKTLIEELKSLKELYTQKERRQ